MALSENESALAGYQASMNLWIYEGNILWSKFNALLVANSVVLTAYGFTAGSGAVVGAFAWALPIAGIVLCLLWAQLMRRGFDNYRYWIYSARELEEKHLSPTTKLVSRGGDYADGSAVSLTIGGAQKPMQIPKPGRLLTAAKGSYLVILTFLALWVILGLDSVI